MLLSIAFILGTACTSANHFAPADGSGETPSGGGGSAGSDAASGGASGSGGRDAGAPVDAAGGAAGSTADVGGDAPPAIDATPPVSTTMATNVRLQKVELTQAVSIALGPDASGAAIAVAARNAKVIENRTTLIRAHVAVGSGWTARNVEAVLVLTGAGGATPLALTKMITASSVAATLDSTFNWTLSDTQAVAGLTAHVELHDLPGAPAGAPALDSPRFPKTGEVDLGIQAGAMQVNAVLVPVTVGGTTLTVTPADLKAWGDYLQGVYPIQKSFLTVHPVVATPWTTFGNAQEDMGFDLCAQTKAMDKAAPNVYHVLLIPGTKATVGWDGSSQVATDKPGDAMDRCSIVITDRTNTLPPKSLVFAHELGHAHGLQHAPCGDAAGPDPRYPYPRAAIGVQGYSILKNVLYDPVKITDFMSYCEPAWVSDFFWNKLETRVRIQTTWGIHHRADDPMIGAPLDGRSVRGLFRRLDGEVRWAQILGEVGEPADTTDSFVRVVDGTRAGASLPFRLRALTATHGLLEFKFTLPADNDATAFDVSIAGHDHRLTLADIADLTR